MDIVVDSFGLFRGEFVILIPNQLRFTESKKDFLLGLLFFLKV